MNRFQLLIITSLSLCLLPLSPPAFSHKGHGSNFPWAACENKEASQVCSYITPSDQKHIGTCQSMHNVLMCVRNKPIIDLNANAIKDAMAKENVRITDINTNARPEPEVKPHSHNHEHSGAHEHNE